MNSTHIFTDRAQKYAHYRPSYPTEAIAAILKGLASSSGLVAADIGAGTGIASRLMSDRDVKVFAIEPNEAMRQQHEQHPLVEFKAATAENTTLVDDSVDLVTSFQAFHWFDPLPTLQEFHRILKPSGRLASIWSVWDETDACTKVLNDLVSLADGSDSDSKELMQFSSQDRLSLEQLIGLVESQGFIPLSGIKHKQLIDKLRQLYWKWAKKDNITIAYRTDVYISQAQKK